MAAAVLSCPAESLAQIFDEDYQDRSNGLDVTGQLGLMSDRMFRGQNLYNGTSVQPQVRSSFKLGEGRIHSRLFGQIGAEGSSPSDPNRAPYEVTNEDGTTEQVVPTQEGFNELDFELGYLLDFSPAKLDFGHRMYFYSESNERLQDSKEFYAEINFDVPFYPYIGMAYDYDAFDGTFYNLGARYPVALGLTDERSILIPFIELGFSSGLDNGDHPIYDGSGLMYVDLGTRSQLYMTKTVSIEPEVWYNFAVDDATSNELTFGVNLVSEFK